MQHFGKVVALVAACALAACGGHSISGASSAGSGGTGGTGGTGGGTTTAPVAALSLTTSATSILADGSTTATVIALARDANNLLIAGVPVSFKASSGGLAVGSTTTDSSGSAAATLSAAGDTSSRAITVTATSGSLTATTTVQVVAGTSSATVQLGSPAGTGFVAGAIGISSNTLSAGGSTTLTVALQQPDGTLYNQSASVSFNSTCVGASQAKINTPVTTSTGVATATYVATGCSGTDAITATTTLGANTLTATGSVTVAPASIGSIIYKSATATVISLKGSGNSAHPETSTVLFQVQDQSGNPVSGASVGFGLNTTVGGITVTQGPVTSDANGNVQTTVQAGTVATPVRVTATVLNTTPTISTQSNQLSVSTGVPTQNEFSMAVGSGTTCPNVEAFDIDGVNVPVTVRLADRFSNPVADGTAVQFNAQGGHIVAQCTTGGAEAGACSVNWTSANPRPSVGAGNRIGRATILAQAIGEESFVDANGNGVFDPGETFTDLSEGYRDDNGNNTYDVGEYFYDFNNNGTRDGPDGLFNGVLCNDPARCDSSKSSAGITTHQLIIMSTSGASVTPASGSTLNGSVAANSSRTYLITVADANGNPMPSGTTIVGAVTGPTAAGLGISAPSTYTIPCTLEPASFAFTITGGAGATTGSGTLTLTITSPKGLITYATYSVPIG